MEQSLHSTARLPLQDSFENDIASLFVARDHHHGCWLAGKWCALSYGVVTVLLSLLFWLVCTGIYAIHFGRFNAVIRVLNALSRR
ncbi:MAG: hypothetical protein R3F37_17805 [Candidatus Competibacteraceae bacterium]